MHSKLSINQNMGDVCNTLLLSVYNTVQGCLSGKSLLGSVQDDGMQATCIFVMSNSVMTFPWKAEGSTPTVQPQQADASLLCTVRSSCLHSSADLSRHTVRPCWDRGGSIQKLVYALRTHCCTPKRLFCALRTALLDPRHII